MSKEEEMDIIRRTIKLSYMPHPTLPWRRRKTYDEPLKDAG